MAVSRDVPVACVSSNVDLHANVWGSSHCCGSALIGDVSMGAFLCTFCVIAWRCTPPSIFVWPSSVYVRPPYARLQHSFRP